MGTALQSRLGASDRMNNQNQNQAPPVPQFEQVAKAFTGHYYATFDSNRAGLSAMYLDCSMLTFEGQKTMGKQNIHNKLTEGIKFQKSRHRIQTLDASPTVERELWCLWEEKSWWMTKKSLCGFPRCFICSLCPIPRLTTSTMICSGCTTDKSAGKAQEYAES